MEICSTCGEEVRYGVRDPSPQWPGPRWLHRTDVDHAVTFGVALTPERWQEVEQRKAAQALASSGGKKKAVSEADFEEEVEDIIGPVIIPDPELLGTLVEADFFPPRSGIRQILNLITKTPGWEGWAWRSRGPYLGANGSVLSISDYILIRARGEEVDGVRPFAVASWRDGSFDGPAWIGRLKGGIFSTYPANSTEMKNWIKGTHDLPEAVREPGERP